MCDTFNKDKFTSWFNSNIVNKQTIFMFADKIKELMKENKELKKKLEAVESVATYNTKLMTKLLPHAKSEDLIDFFEHIEFTFKPVTKDTK